MKNETEALSEKIIELQEKRTRKLGLLKGQLHATYESLKPINLIKSTLKEVSSSPEIKSSIFGNVIGFGTGFLTKKLWVGHSHNPIKKLFGTLIQFAISNVVSKQARSLPFYI